MAHGRYTILGKLADGGMAEIFLAMQHGAEGFQKPVVLKRVLTAFSADPQFRNMFLDEAHISMSLNHGNIVQVLDVGVAGERTFLVLELIEGWDLEQVMDRAQATGPEQPWPPSLALYVTAQICRALAYAHAKRGMDGRPLGIVHRDVSPTNVLISEQGEVKLADFGIAKAESKREQTLAGVIKGKIGFMSPEQALGRPLDARADLFSVGTVMYLMLTGRRPFMAASELESMMLAQRAEYRPPQELNPYLSPAATEIVDRAMQREPSQRYQTADEMLVDVERVLRSQYHSAGQTELKLWLAELAQRDGALPIGRPRAGDDARPVFVDESGDLSAGSSLELSDVDGAAAAAAAAAVTAAAAAVTAVAPAVAGPAAVTPAPLAARPTSTPVGPVESLAATTEGSRVSRASEVSEAAPVASVTLPTPQARIPRRSRVSLGFVLGALFMLGTVFGIRWLAQWAGRERSEISDSNPAAAHAPAPASPQVALAGGNATNDSAVAFPGGGRASTGGDAVSGVRAAAEPTGGGGGTPEGRTDGSASVASTAASGEDDETRLLGRLVPDASAVVGEDEAEENPRGRGASAKGKDRDRDRDKDRTSGQSGGAGRVGRLASTEKGGATRNPGAASPRAQAVQIRITTSPLGAVVRTKKQVLGRTPVAVHFKPGNIYELTFVKSGYLTNRRRLTVVAGKPLSISVAMKKAAPPARHSFFRGR